MADTIATYHFMNWDNYTAAKAALQQQLGGSSYDTYYSGTGNDAYIYITRDCSDIERASEICRGYGGKAS